MPRKRRFFFAGKRVVVFADALPAAGVLCFAAGEIRHIVCINIKKKGKEIMKIIQQDEKIIAYIDKDETNERKIVNNPRPR